MAKSFKTAAETFISKSEPAAPAPAEFVAPKGYQLVPEYRSARMQLLVQPATKEAIVNEAKAQGISTNELVNQIFAEWLESR